MALYLPGIIEIVFVDVNPELCFKLAVGILDLPIRKKRREKLLFFSKLYTPYDVIPIRKPWNNGVGVLMVSEYISIISQLTLSFIIFPASFFSYIFDLMWWLWCSFFPKYSPWWPKTKKYECVFLFFPLLFFFSVEHYKQTNLQKWPKKCLACICALPFSIPSMCCNAELVWRKVKKRRFLTFLCVCEAQGCIDGAACPLCPPTINHISEARFWPLSSSPHMYNLFYIPYFFSKPYKLKNHCKLASIFFNCSALHTTTFLWSLHTECLEIHKVLMYLNFFSQYFPWPRKTAHIDASCIIYGGAHALPFDGIFGSYHNWRRCGYDFIAIIVPAAPTYIIIFKGSRDHARGEGALKKKSVECPVLWFFNSFNRFVKNVVSCCIIIKII